MAKAYTLLTSFKDEFEQEVFREICSEFRDYRYWDIGFGALLKSLINEWSGAILRIPAFRKEIKYDLKLIMNYLHMVNDKNLIRDIKTSLYPMLLLGAGGNRTVIKRVILATHLSVKAVPFIARTYQELLQHPKNHDPEFIAQVYSKMLNQLRHLHVMSHKVEMIQDLDIREAKRAQVKRAKWRHKSILRRKTSLPPLYEEPDDPYRSLAVFRKKGHSFVQIGMTE